MQQNTPWSLQKEERITECRSRLETLMKDGGYGSDYLSIAPNTASVSEDPPTFSSPTTLTTTALIELQPCNENTGSWTASSV